jgi:tetratricopeptide (TPR) repeat protein
LQSRERSLAIAAIIKAADASQASANKKDAANLYFRSAQLQFDESDFNGAIKSFAKARELGLGSKQTGISLLMQGNAYFELEDYSNAKVYFSKALKEPSSTNSAKAWLEYMEQLELLD